MDIDLRINEVGDKRYNKWVKETQQGLFLYIPALLVFYLWAGTLIYGFTFTFMLISVFPIALILSAFVRPYFSRKFLNKMVRELRLADGNISIETYKWFSLNAIIKTFPANTISIISVSDYPLFRGNKVREISSTAVPNVSFFIVDEYFDHLTDLLQFLGKDVTNQQP